MYHMIGFENLLTTKIINILAIITYLPSRRLPNIHDPPGLHKRKI
jgi:hypothetical protein